MRRFLPVLLLFTATAAADEVASTTVVIPVVGSVVGPNDVRWKTDVELHNDLRGEATVVLSLPMAKDQPMIMLTIPPGGAQRFTDVVGEAFGADSVLSPLLIQTMGRRSVRVAASAYGLHGSDITKPQSIPIVDAGSYFPLRSLTGVAYSDHFRTNIGLVNLGETEAVFTLVLRTESGATAAGTRVVVPPNSMWHMAVQLLFPLMNKADNYTLLAETGARETYVYASVVDNESNEARFIVPTVGTR